MMHISMIYSGPQKYSSTHFLIGIHKENLIFKGNWKKIKRWKSAYMSKDHWPSKWTFNQTFTITLVVAVPIGAEQFKVRVGESFWKVPQKYSSIWRFLDYLLIKSILKKDFFFTCLFWDYEQNGIKNCAGFCKNKHWNFTQKSRRFSKLLRSVLDEV